MPAEYDKIAALMASDPPLMFFRRFGELNAKNIIYYQAELAGLAVELDAIISLDRKSGAGNAKEYPFSVGHLKGTLGNPKEISMQWEKFLEIRRLLKEYSMLFCSFFSPMQLDLVSCLCLSFRFQN